MKKPTYLKILQFFQSIRSCSKKIKIEETKRKTSLVSHERDTDENLIWEWFWREKKGKWPIKSGGVSGTHWSLKTVSHCSYSLSREAPWSLHHFTESHQNLVIVAIHLNFFYWLLLEISVPLIRSLETILFNLHLRWRFEFKNLILY